MSTRKQRLSRLVAGLGLTLALAAGTIMPALAAEATLDASATITPGSLTVTAADAPTFSHQLTGDLAVVDSDGTSTIDVADLTGSGEGWNLQVSATPFALVGDATETLGDFSINSAPVTCVSAGGECGDLASDTTGGVIDAGGITVLSADPGEGMGRFQFKPDFSLEIPATAMAGDYESTVTFTITAGP